MLAITRSQTAAKPATCSPNVLPCRIRHDGPVNASTRYWSPQEEADGSTTAYFRGRKLRGRRVLIPDGYRGAILNKTERSLESQEDKSNEQEADAEMDEDESEEPEDIRALDEIASFEHFTVWGHEALPDDKDNPLIRGVGEWIKFAEAMHAPNPQSKSGATESR